MARPPAFDRAEVVDRAMRVFWTQGVRGTSMRTLVQATGLKPGSLYAAFGSKDGLFREALAAYSAQVRTAASGADPTTLIEIWFAAHIERSVPHGEPGRGCLLLASASELSALEAESVAAVKGELEALERTFAACVARMGTTKGPEPVAVARLLVAALAGISTLARAGADRQVLEDVARAALTLL
ncbi:MAG: TetR/AcrR family transcriptional regulator [Myxococcales bacterium]|nr:TetR/AcrR family transcriptional regulator [Myxococcales bacterium]